MTLLIIHLVIMLTLTPFTHLIPTSILPLNGLKRRSINFSAAVLIIILRIRTCVYHGVRNNSFSENLTCFVFLKHPF